MRTTRWIEFNGERKALVEWAGRFAISPNVVRRRLARGWPVEIALAQPSGYRLKRTWRLRP